MARMAAVSTWSNPGAWLRVARRCFGWPATIAAGVVVAVALACGAKAAEPVKGEATLSAGGGYARLLLKLDEDVESDVSVAGTIMIIRFKRPVDISVAKL